MKLTDLSIIFSMLCICFFVSRDLKMDLYQKNEVLMEEYNRVIDKAAWDCMQFSVESQYYDKMSWNPEEVIARFQKNLSSGFGFFEDEWAQQNLMDHISVIVLTEADGYYVYGYQEGEGQDQGSYQLSEKKYFYRNGEKITDPFGQEGEDRRIVINTIVREMEEYIAKDSWRKKIGKSYKVTLPYIHMEEWYQGVEELSILVFFQGHPLELDGKCYQRFVFSGARIERAKEGN